MKRRVLCIFVLILWGLIFCTLLSVRIEQLMIPRVVLTQADENEPTAHIALDALFFDDTGMHLYRPRDGSGWEAGKRIYEEDSANYTVGTDRLDLKLYGSYVRYASKPLRSGDLIEIETNAGNRNDIWLAVFPDGIPPLSDTLTPTEETENALLFDVPDAPQPFMSDRAKSMILPASELANENVGSFYSLSDIQSFLTQMPLLAVLFALALFVLILWIYSFVLSRSAKENRVKLIVNGVLSILALLAVPLVLQNITLPSSLLPQYRITDIAYYANEFSVIFKSLSALSETGATEAAAILKAADAARGNILLIALLAPIAAGAVILLETLLKKVRHTKTI